MQQISFLTVNDVKEAVLAALTEHESKKPQQNTNPEQYIYGLQGLADFLNVGVTTAWKIRKSGKIPSYQAGKKLFFKKSEVEKSTINFR